MVIGMTKQNENWDEIFGTRDWKALKTYKFIVDLRIIKCLKPVQKLHYINWRYFIVFHRQSLTLDPIKIFRVPIDCLHNTLVFNYASN